MSSLIRIILTASLIVLLLYLFQNSYHLVEWVRISSIIILVNLIVGLLVARKSDFFPILYKRPSLLVFPIAMFLVVISILLWVIQSQYLHLEWFSSENSDLFPSYRNIYYLIYSVLYSVILAAVIEEIFFRRLLFEILAKKISNQLSVLIVALTFGLLHGDLFGAFIFSIVLSIIYLADKNLVHCIWIHVLNNAMAVLIFSLEDYQYLPSWEYEILPSVSKHPWWLAISLFIVCMLLYWMVSMLINTKVIRHTKVN